MQKNVPVVIFATALALAIGLMNLLAVHPAEARVCDALPNVEWWVNSPAKIKKLVQTRYKGDWDAYIVGWRRYHDSMQRSLENGEARLIKSRGITLRGPTLVVHVLNIKKRIEVLDCLSGGNQAAAENLEAFATAAGGEPAENSSVRPSQLADAGKCDPLPKADWWNNSPAAIKRSVAKRYGGDWDKYIERWRRHYDSMKQSFENNQPRFVKSRGVTLRGKILEKHVAKIKKRIEVFECMQRNVEASSAAARLSPAASRSSVAAVSGAQMDLEVEAHCEDARAGFKLTNVGEKWPRMGEINIYRTDTRALIVKRRLRMRDSQQMTFKIPRDKLKGIGEVGIFVKPSWYEREFKYDATANCGE